MTLTPITTEQCLDKLNWYANTEVRSWNPFKLFRKIKLKNHRLASEMADILKNPIPSDKELLKIASSIDKFEDSKLQHDLLCFLYTNISDGKKSFITTRDNKTQLTKTLNHLLEKKYWPWWTLFLVQLPYYSDVFRSNLTWLITKVSNVFTTRRKTAKQQRCTREISRQFDNGT